jgi:predicted RND superfamily exporter protein
LERAKRLILGHKAKDFSYPFFWCIVTIFSSFLFHTFVDLKPKVEENFFFSSNDPQFRADASITRLFPQPPQIILSAIGDISSEDYHKRIDQLTVALLALPEVVEVQSLTRGPKDVAHALDSPLWKRALISTDKKSSFISVMIKNVPIENAISKIEKLKTSLDSPGHFELIISGAPYIVEIIRRNLLRDLKVFSLVAFLVFAAAVYVLFRSFPILLGTLLSCLNVSMLTLAISAILKIKIGPLTSNLSVIVFVLALSHIIFITFNWKHVLETDEKKDSVSEAVKITFLPSFWSMVTQLLGFLSLFFVKATPLRQLGISGIVGTIIAFSAAYLIYPAFLRFEALRFGESYKPSVEKIKKIRFFEKKHRKTALCLICLTVFAGLGIRSLNKDPSLFSYFKKGSELRNGLEYIDQNGGSTPLKIVVADVNDARLDTNDSYEKLWRLHLGLERDPSVGNVLSLPIILAEAKRHPLGSFMPNDWLLNILGTPASGEVTKYFITKDRKSTLFLLRMKEMNRDKSRLSIVKRVEEIVKSGGFNPLLIGGVYLLQGKLSELVVSSILSGLLLLIIIFTLIGGLILRSFRVAWAIFISLCMIPLWTIGIIGHFRIPFDIISSPGANIAIGIGVDSMINMLFFVKRHLVKGKASDKIWSQACVWLWKPILYSTVLICMGFGIFVLSVFPPTQRFGLSVILGSLISPLAALFVFPWIARGSPRTHVE